MEQADGRVEAALHPAREVLDRLLGPGGQLDELEELGGPLLQVGPRHVVQAAPEEQVVHGAELVVEGHVLGHDAQAVLDLPVGEQVPALEVDGPGEVAERPRQDGDERRLARPVGAEQAQHLALLQLQGETVEGQDVAVGFGQVLDLEHGRHTLSGHITIIYAAEPRKVDGPSYPLTPRLCRGHNPRLESGGRPEPKEDPMSNPKKMTLLLIASALLCLSAAAWAQLPPAAEVVPAGFQVTLERDLGGSKVIEATKPNENFPKPHMDQGITLQITWQNNPAADMIVKMLAQQPEEPAGQVPGLGDPGGALRHPSLPGRRPRLPQSHHPLDRRRERPRARDLAHQLDRQGPKRARRRQYQQFPWRKRERHGLDRRHHPQDHEARLAVTSSRRAGA